MKKSQKIVLISFLIFCIGVFVTALFITGNPYKNNQLKKQMEKYKNVNRVKIEIETKYRKNKNTLPKIYFPEEIYEGITYNFVSKRVFEVCIDKPVSYDLYEKKRRILSLPYLSSEEIKYIKEGIKCFKYEMEKTQNWPRAEIIDPKPISEPIVLGDDKYGY